MTIIPYDPSYRDDMIFMVLLAKDALGRTPTLNEDLLNIPGHYNALGGAFWLAVSDEGRVVGCVGFVPESEDTGRLHRLYVKPALKRQGIGTRLLHTAEDAMRAAGYRWSLVHLGGPQHYWESRLFYPSRGYVEFSPGWMHKDLTAKNGGS